jgi:plasmid stabilization system protein ParE
MRRVRLTALAEFDLVEAQDFYAPNGAWVLDHFMESIDRAIIDLSESAGIHPVRFGHHRMGVPHFPFSIYYDIEGDDIVVKAILDDRFGPARIAAHFGPKFA